MEKNFISLDLEMTGLSPFKDRIIEIAAVKYVDGVIEDTFSTLINPNMLIPEKVTALTGITNENTSESPFIEDVFDDFVDFLGENILLGHFVQMDYSFIVQNAYNLNNENYLKKKHFGIDTLKIAKKYLPDLEGKRLSQLCQYYNIEDNNHHRAENDAIITAKLYMKMCEEFENEGNQGNQRNEGNQGNQRNEGNQGNQRNEGNEGNQRNEGNEGNYENQKSMIKPEMLIYKPKKTRPVSKKQLSHLTELINYYNISFNFNISEMSQNDVCRLIDKIILKYGKIPETK